MKKAKKRKSQWLKTLSPNNVEMTTMTTMAYIEAGLVPPAGSSPWFAPHAPFTTHEETLPPCEFPRSARRKFRKEWRRAVEGKVKAGEYNQRTAKRYKAMGPSEKTDTLVPTHSARVARRALVLDAMVRRGEEILVGSEQSSSGSVESITDVDPTSE